MTKSNSIIKILSVLMIFILTILSVNSATSLNVVLSNQDPDPVSPGNFVFLNVKLSNAGSDSIKDASIKMIENENFKIAQGSDLTKEIGNIPAFSSGEGSSSFTIAKYKVEVDPNTPLGLNTIEFEVEADLAIYEYEFDVLVEDENPRVQVNIFKLNSIEPGKSEKLSIEVENINTVDLRDVTVSLDLDAVENDILSVTSGTNEITIPFIKAGEKQKVEFDIVTSPDSESKPYLLPVNISYEDSLGNSFSSNVLGSVRIFSQPQVSLSIDSQDIYTEGKGKVTLAIANFGTSSVKGTQIEILSSDDYEIISGSSQYIGDLNPDDFQTIQSEIYLRNSNAASLKVKMIYLDSYNVESEQILDIPLKIYDKNDLEKFGLSSGGSSGGSGASSIVTLVLLIIAFFIGRHFGYKKAKKRNK